MRTNGLRAALGAAALLLGAGLAGAAPAFNKESAVVFSSAAPQDFSGAYPNLRMYFIRLSSQTEVGSALSPDGIAWTEDAGGGRLSTTTLPTVSASSITGCAVMPIAGGFRMLYSIVSTTGAFRIHSATSADGLAWANDAGVRLETGNFLTSPKLAMLQDGSWRMYFVGSPGNSVFTSRSTDSGLTWSAPAVAMSTPAFEIGTSVLTNGRVRLYYTESLPGVSSGAVILSALSTDTGGTAFNLESGVRVSTSVTSGSVAFPVPVRSTGTDSFRWRLYYNYADPGVISTADVHTALTGPPAPASIAPAYTINDTSTRTVAVSGEIFSLAPALQLSLGGNVLSPTSLTRVDDQTLTATFDVLNAPTGRWDLKVTNADAQTATLGQAFFIDYPGGSTTLVNNLLRPRTGTATKIDVTTFNDGVITARLYTIDGRKLRTLFDGFRSKGVLTLSWDGRDSTGAAVASGVYVLRVVGPKVDVKDKIVVIR